MLHLFGCNFSLKKKKKRKKGWFFCPGGGGGGGEGKGRYTSLQSIGRLDFG